MTDSPIRATLIATKSLVELGDVVAVSAFVFEEDAPVADAAASVVVRPETGEPVTLDLLDDGVGADGVAGDGVYSAPVFPESTGEYSVVGAINGLTAGGVPFEREVATGFKVISPQGRIVNIVDDRAVDDDLDGVFDRVTVDVAVEIFTGGTFDLLIQLLTNDDRRLTRKSESNLLSPGTQTIAVSFESEGLVSVGVDGPYGGYPESS